MRLKELLSNNSFRIPTNNYYNSRGWYLLLFRDLPAMMELWYGRREILDSLLDYGELTPDALTDIERILELTLKANAWKYDHLYELYTAEYNPLWNYDGKETRTVDRTVDDDHSGYDSDVETGSTTVNYNGSQKDTNSGSLQSARTTFDSDTDYDTDKDVDTRSVERTYTNRNDKTDHGKTVTHNYNNNKDVAEHTVETMERGGNQGTTTTQAMFLEELDVAGKLHLMEEITLDLVNSICYS